MNILIVLLQKSDRESDLVITLALIIALLIVWMLLRHLGKRGVEFVGLADVVAGRQVGAHGHGGGRLGRAADGLQVQGAQVLGVHGVVVDVEGVAVAPGVGLHEGVVAHLHGGGGLRAVPVLQRMALEVEAAAVLQEAVLVHAEGAGAGVGVAVALAGFGRLVGDEEPLAGDGHVGGRAGGLEKALLVHPLARRRLHAAGGVLGLRHLGGDQGVEVDVGPLVAGGVHVGDVVRNGAHGAGLRLQSGNAG